MNGGESLFNPGGGSLGSSGRPGLPPLGVGRARMPLVTFVWC